MSEVQSRPAPRGRGAGRGGRGGGYSTRGGARSGTRNSATNGDSTHDAESALPSLDDGGDVGQLKKQYGTKVSLIKEMFPDWSEVDILYALQETDGDESVAVTRIADGTISQWGEVSKQKKDRTRAKSKNDTFTTTTGDAVIARPSRGGRGTEGSRGGRGRATERGGRGGTRGKSTHATTNGTRAKENTQLSVPTEEATEWDNEKPAGDANAWGESNNAWESTPSTETATAPAPAPATKKPSVPPQNAPKTWASMLRQSTAPKPAPKPKEPPAPKPAEPIIEPLPSVEAPAPEPEPVVPDVPAPEPERAKPTVEPPNVVIPEIALPPSKDQLTETNLEQVADDSNPPVTETTRSEAADSWDPRAAAVSATATPLSASQHQHQVPRAPASGYATSAIKATERTSTRTPSYQRRLLDQEEAVRMPGNREQVDRTALQFGAFSLHGPDDEDVDGDREEPETRTQPPADSPVAHPRTSLPPSQPAPVPEVLQKPTGAAAPAGQAGTGFPPSVPPGFSTNNAPAAPAPPSGPAQPAAAAQAGAQPSAQNPQFGRFGQPAQEQSSFPGSKPFDTFGQQQPATAAAQSQFEGGFQNQQPPSQPQSQQQQQPGGALSSAPSDYSAYYTAGQDRNAYNNYYNQNFSQQHGAQGQQEGASQGQRSFSGYNAQDNLSQYPQSAAHRFGTGSAAADAQNSGTNTPNPPTSQGQPQAATQAAQSHAAQQQPHDYPYNSHPYYNNPYYSAYMGGYGQGGYNQGGYGGPYGKGLGYGQPNQFGVSPQGPHGYGSSPAAGFGGQSSLHRGDSGGLSDYSRVGSGQSSAQQGLGGSSFGGIHDSFGRSGSSYPSQSGQGFNGGAQSNAGPAAADDLKPFGDKAGSGPSPSLASAAARPGSATNTAASQGGLPPPQSSQQSALGGMGGYGGYPSHLPGQGLHSNQSGGYGMSAGAGAGHQNNYGGYGGQGFGGSYYANQQQQQQRGWGNNYGHH
ncbi:hypothetical protein GQ53DRAFT_329511 [Thozetella sp. PMI_491]|nr:hypothetical protein GQ53DRAFT_329511 [Thozetella sp. PMI_491]